MQQHRVPIRLGKLRTSVRDSPAAADIAVHIGSSIISSGGDTTGAALFSASVARVCRVCTQNASRYTCPRCNAPYCSVACYKRHGESCTERFYEDHVRDIVQLDSKSSSERDAQRKMNDMLARVKQFQDESADRMTTTDDDADSEEDQELQMEMLEALARLALADGESISLDDLTPAQRKQFLTEVADGRLSKFIRLWLPWWLMDARKYEKETEVKRRQLAIQEIRSGDGDGSVDSEGDDDEDDVEASGPVMIESAVFPAELFTRARAAGMPEDLNGLLPHNKPPSPALRVHLIELLFSYALVMRTFNGDWQQDVSEAATALLHLSTVLNADAKYESIEHVLHACVLKRIDTEYEGGGGAGAATGPGSREVNQRILHDVTLLLSAKVFVLDALSDAQAMLVAYKNELLTVAQKVILPPAATDTNNKPKKKKSTKAEKERRHVIKRLEFVDRKLQFFITWAFHTSEAHFQTTAREIERAAAASEAVGS